VSQIIGYIEDFFELITLEAHSAKKSAARAALLTAGVAVLALLAALSFEIAALGGLLSAGLPLWQAALILGAAQLILVAAMLAWIIASFRKQADFEATREEFKRTVQWIKRLWD
jgi:uncharacterized membrane protein YqjE